MNVKITLHDNVTYTEEITGFDLDNFIEELNTESYKMVKFGHIGVLKNSIRVVDTNASTDVEPELT